MGRPSYILLHYVFRKKISPFLIIQERSYPGVIYCQDHYVFKTVSSPGIEENMCGVIESADLMYKYAVADQRNYGKVVGHLPMGKTGKFAKAIFNFLKKDKKHFVDWMCQERPQVLVIDGEWKFLIAEEKYINVLKEKLSMLL